MNKGKLKERIMNLSLGLEPWVHEEDEGSASLLPHQYNVNLEEILDLLDEVFKEFPKPNDADTEDDRTYYWYDYDEIKAWLLKWRGEYK